MKERGKDEYLGFFQTTEQSFVEKFQFSSERIKLQEINKLKPSIAKNC